RRGVGEPLPCHATRCHSRSRPSRPDWMEALISARWEIRALLAYLPWLGALTVRARVARSRARASRAAWSDSASCSWVSLGDGEGEGVMAAWLHPATDARRGDSLPACRSEVLKTRAL